MSTHPSHLVLPPPPPLFHSPSHVDPTHLSSQSIHSSTIMSSMTENHNADDDDDDDDIGYEDMSTYSRSVPPLVSHSSDVSATHLDNSLPYPMELQQNSDDEDDESDIDYVGEDLGDSRTTTSRKRGRPSSSTRNGKKSKKKSTPSDTPSIPSRLAGLDPDAQARVMVMTQELDSAIKATSSHRSRRTDIEDPQRLEERATLFLDRMKLAALQDQEAHETGRPALAKLNMLKELESELERIDMRDILLDHHILEGFITWLEPLRLDGSLPAFQVRKTLMEVLLKLPISTDHLREDRIGRVVMFYAKYTKETPEIRRLAHQCISKWTRPILNLSDTYADTHEQPQVDINLSAVRRQRVLRTNVNTMNQSPMSSSSTNTTSINDKSSSQRLRLPISRGTGYTVRPVDNLPDAAALRKRSTPSGLARVVSKLRQGGQNNDNKSKKKS